MPRSPRPGLRPTPTRPRLLWIISFAPLCLGMAIGGVLGHPVFLVTCVLWVAALLCVLRGETTRHHAEDGPAPRDQLVRAGWICAALLLIVASAGVVHVALD